MKLSKSSLASLAVATCLIATSALAQQININNHTSCHCVVNASDPSKSVCTDKQPSSTIYVFSSTKDVAPMATIPAGDIAAVNLPSTEVFLGTDKNDAEATTPTDVSELPKPKDGAYHAIFTTIDKFPTGVNLLSSSACTLSTVN